MTATLPVRTHRWLVWGSVLLALWGWAPVAAAPVDSNDTTQTSSGPGFHNPAPAAGPFNAMPAHANHADLSVIPFGHHATPPGDHMIPPSLWDDTPGHQNHGPFFELRNHQPPFGPDNIRNDPPGPTDSDPSIEDELLTRHTVPEPGTNALVLFSVGLFVLRWPAIHRRLHA